MFNCWGDYPIDQEMGGVPETGYAPFNFPVDGDVLLFRFTDETFTQVLSALINGAMITYPEDWIQVLWHFLVNVEYPLPICEQLIECIETNGDVQAALADFLANNTLARQAIKGVSDKGAPLTGEGGAVVQNDDLAALFGAVSYVVDTMHDAIMAFYAAYEVTTNKRELGELVFEAIPVIETLPIDEISQYVSMMEETVVEGFISQYDTTPITGTRDRIRCALFCAATLNENTLTWSMIEDYFWGRVGFTVSNITNVIGEMVVFLGTGSWEGEEIVDISFGNFAAAMRGSQRFGLMTFPKLSTLMALGQNDPDEDYEIVCEGCTPEPPGYCYDFTISKQGWEWYNYPEGSFGSYDASGFGRGTSADLIIYLEITSAVSEVVVTFNEPQANVIIRALGSFSAMSANSTESLTEHTIPITIGDGTNGIMIWVDNMESTTRLISACAVPAP